MVAQRVTAAILIPTIGIGAGVDATARYSSGTICSASTPDAPPRFVKRYAEIGDAIREALERPIVAEVRNAGSPGSSTRTRCRRRSWRSSSALRQISANTPTIAASNASAATSEPNVRGQLQPWTTRTPIARSTSDHAATASWSPRMSVSPVPSSEPPARKVSPP